jgi:hypothetical protein
MFTELVITIGGRRVVFKAHEIVLVVQNIMETYILPEDISDQVIIPSMALHNSFIKEMLSKTTGLGIIAGAIDKHLILPMHINGLDSALKWLYASRKLHLRHHQERNAVEGTWAAVAGRLLLIKNTEKMLFYVSDHGYVEDLVQKVKNLVFNFEWTNPQLMYIIVQIHKKLESMPPETKKKFKDDLIESFKSQDIQALRGLHIDCSDEETEQILDPSISNQIELFLNIEESSMYTIFVLVKKYMRMKKALNNFDFKIFRNFYVHNEAGDAIKKTMKVGGVVKSWEERLYDAHRFIKIRVLQQVAEDISADLQEPFFRPISSYGDKAYGSTYRTLELAFADYFTKAEHASEAELAFTIRQILRGQNPALPNCSFVASLVGAWFIAEPARNLVSLLSGLMLLDMIENNVLLLDNYGNNWYSWRNVLIHPFKGAGSKREKEARDLYGAKVKNIDRELGGAHPMAHAGSAAESYEMQERNKLTVMHQKEASLFLHWLKLYLDKKGIESRLASVAEQKLNPSDVIFSDVSVNSSDSPRMVQLDKKIADLKKTIRTRATKRLSIDMEEKKLKILQVEKEGIEFKQKIQMQLIVPAIKERLESLDKQDFRIIGWLAVQSFLPSVVINYIVHEYLGFKGTRSSFVGNVLAASSIAGYAPVTNPVGKESLPSYSASGGSGAMAKKGHNSQYILIEGLFTKLLSFVSKSIAEPDKLASPQGYEDVPGDGLCFYHAIARQLDVVGSNDSLENQQRVAKALQELAINEILNNLSIYEAFIAQHGGLNGFLNYHLQRQNSNEGGWADNIMIQALANALGHRIEIQLFNLQGGPIGFAPPIVPRNDPHAPVLRLGNIANLHFVAAIRGSNFEQHEESKIEDNVYDPVPASSDGGDVSSLSSSSAERASGNIEEDVKITMSRSDVSITLEGSNGFDYEKFSGAKGEEHSNPSQHNVPTPAPIIIVPGSAPVSMPNATLHSYYEELESGDASSFKSAAILMLSGIDSAVSNSD